MPTMRICVAGCPTLGITVYKFPPEDDMQRRELWFRQFGLHPSLYGNKTVYICRRHFSGKMACGRTLHQNAYPDVNLRKFDKDRQYTERHGAYYRCGVPPPGEDLVMAISTENVTLNCDNPAAELSDNDVIEIVLPQVDDEQSSINNILCNVGTYVPYQKRQCILKCQGRRKFYKLPSLELDLERRKKWLYLLAKDPDLYQGMYHYVCDLHFNIHMIGKNHLIRGAYPNSNLPPPLQKSIPEDMEAKTECFQKCVDYEKKFRFPTVEREAERRKIWIQQFGCDPEFYNHEIFACDRHFSDFMRVGPFLRREAIPDQNLNRVIPAVQNNGHLNGERWSAANAAPRPLTAPATQVNQNIKTLIPDITSNGNFVSKNYSIKRLQTLAKDAPRLAEPASHIIQKSALPNLLVNRKNTPSTTHTVTPKRDIILKHLNMTIMPPVVQPERPTSTVQYVKMHTLGVFVPRMKGFLLPVDKISSIEDPLNIDKFQPFDWVKPINPEMTMDVQTIDKANYGDYSSDDDDKADSEEVNSTPEEITDDESDKDWQSCGKRRSSEGIHEEEIKRMKLAQVDDQADGYLSDNTEGTEDYLYAMESEDEAEAAPDENVNNYFLEHLATSYPTESFSILLGENYKVVEYRKETGSEINNGDDIITPDEPNILELYNDGSDHGSHTSASTLPAKPINVDETDECQVVEDMVSTPTVETIIVESDDESHVEPVDKNPNVITVISTQPLKSIIPESTVKIPVGTQIGFKLPVDPIIVQAAVKNPVNTTIGLRPHAKTDLTQHSTKNFAENFLNAQHHKRPCDILLTKEVALAESWQQVKELMGKKSVNETKERTNSVTKAPQKETDKHSTVTKCTNEKGTTSHPISAALPKRIQTVKVVPKTKQFLNANDNFVLSNHSNVESSNTTSHKHSQSKCILNCRIFDELYAFPSAITEPQRRHFWLLELRLKLTSNWHKSLYICNRHFADCMFIEKGALHNLAYPCRESSQQKLANRNAGTQTNINDVGWYNYEELLSEFNKLKEFDSQQTKSINRIKVLIRLKQEAMRLVAEIESSKEVAEDK